MRQHDSRAATPGRTSPDAVSASRRAAGLREVLDEARRRDRGLTIIEDLDELPGGAGAAAGRTGRLVGP